MHLLRTQMQPQELVSAQISDAAEIFYFISSQPNRCRELGSAASEQASGSVQLEQAQKNSKQIGWHVEQN